MRYNVGAWKDHIFVYNSEDSTCMMVKKESGVDYSKHKSLTPDINKLKLLYGFSGLGRTLTRKIVSYDLIVANYSITVYLSIRLIPTDKAVFSWFKDGSDYIIFVEKWIADGLSLCRFINEDDLFSYVMPVGYNLCSGIVISLEMLNYIMTLYDNRDIDGVFKAFDNFFYDKMKFFVGTAERLVLGYKDVVWN